MLASLVGAGTQLASVSNQVYYEAETEISAVGIILILLFSLAFYVIHSWLLMRLGNRMGYENSWFAWIPILNVWMMTQLAGRDIVFFLLALFVPCVNIVIMIIMFMDIAEKCGKERNLGILIIIPIANIWLLYELGNGPPFSYQGVVQQPQYPQQPPYPPQPPSQ